VYIEGGVGEELVSVVGVGWYQSSRDGWRAAAVQFMEG
jgi:hypothetical protein